LSSKIGFLSTDWLVFLFMTRRSNIFQRIQPRVDQFSE